MGNAQSAFQGGVTGASIGAAGGPIGAGIGGALGLGLGAFTDVFGGGDNDAMKKLIRKQEELAKQVSLDRIDRQIAGGNARGQQLAAFDPLNKTLARINGADSAFTPEQFAAMAKSPMPRPELESKYWNYQGRDKKTQAYIEDFMRKQQQWDEAEAARQEMVRKSISRPESSPHIRPTRVAAPPPPVVRGR